VGTTGYRAGVSDRARCLCIACSVIAGVEITASATEQKSRAARQEKRLASQVEVIE